MNKKIIIVEDDQAISDILRIILEKNGYAVEEYLYGQPLMEGNIKWPDLFLIDKQLLDIDGLEICSHLKQQPSTKNIPVIILSAMPGLDDKAKNAGAEAFIEKPFTINALLSAIENLLFNAPIR